MKIYYIYKLISYSNVKIICKKHGVFEQNANTHRRGSGCSICKISRGELKIEQYLKENNIKYKIQKRFKHCKNKNRLPFDFYLSEYNICIEYDGELHYKKSRRYNAEYKLKQTKINDKIKTKYCKDSNIKLIRIPYWEFKNIENKLKMELLDETKKDCNS